MIGRKLRQLRLARSLSLEALAAEMGGIVTKQALSKYEHDTTLPSPAVLAKLTNVFGIRAAYLFHEQGINIEFISRRKRSPLTKRDERFI